MSTRAKNAKSNLFDAITNLDVAKAEGILKQKNSPNIYNENGIPALIYCIQTMTKGINSNASGKGRRCRKLGCEMMRTLLQHGADVDCVDSSGSTVAIFAAKRNYLEILKLLKEFEAKFFVANKFKETPLSISLRHGNYECAKYLLENSTSHQIKARAGMLLISALHSTKTQCLELLFDVGCDLEFRGPEGYTLLMEAVRNRYTNVVKYLLKRGACVNAKSAKGETPLMKASEHSWGVKCVRLLVEAGADLDAKDKEGCTALIYAMKNHFYNPFRKACDTEVIKLLIKYGANLDTGDNDGCTALMHAAEKRHPFPCMELLLRAGANIEAQDKEGLTVLSFVLLEEEMDTAMCLLNHGAKVDTKDHEGNSPLSLCLRSLQRNMDVDTDDDDYDFPFFIDGVGYTTQTDKEHVPMTVDYMLDLGGDLGLSLDVLQYFGSVSMSNCDNILQKMVQKGCPPLLFPIDIYNLLSAVEIPFEHSGLPGIGVPFSALEISLLNKNPGKARYFLAIRFLTKRDIMYIPRKAFKLERELIESSEDSDSNYEANETRKVLQVLQESPFSLYTLSFVAVSSMLTPYKAGMWDEVCLNEILDVDLLQFADEMGDDKSSDSNSSDSENDSERKDCDDDDNFSDVSSQSEASASNQLETVCANRSRPLDSLGKRPAKHSKGDKISAKRAKLTPEDQSHLDQIKTERKLSRREKVQQLPLPESLKKALLFQTATASENPNTWLELPLDRV